MSDIRWAYAINQWKPQFDDFVRREQHERALKTMSIAGFAGVELTAGTGRWEPLGNPEQLTANFGSLPEFRRFVSDCGLSTVSSWFLDPQQRSMEHLTPPRSLANEDDVPGIVAQAEWFAAALAELGGSVLVVPAAPPAGDSEPLDAESLQSIGRCWQAVGEAIEKHGIALALHVDFLSAVRESDKLEEVLSLTDPAVVGLAVDTGELTVAGIDPAQFIRNHRRRIRHVQFKDALAIDEQREYLQPHAFWAVRVRGGVREIPRWFAEPGVDGGLVDFPAALDALVEIDYSGWVVFESDQSPHPAASTLLGGYLLQRELLPLAGR